jgi:hypothetical protein
MLKKSEEVFLSEYEVENLFRYAKEIRGGVSE